MLIEFQRVLTSLLIATITRKTPNPTRLSVKLMEKRIECIEMRHGARCFCHCARVFSRKCYLNILGAIFQLQSIELCRVIVLLYTIIVHYKHSALMVNG